MKRFWKAAHAEPAEGGFGVSLDGRAVKTPSKQALVVPSAALAQAIAAEWDAQREVVKPETMPFTRLANSALDKVRVQHAEVAAMLAEYGGSDLLCYRAEAPEGLVARQAAAWDPLLARIAAEQGVRLNVQTGVMPTAQPAEALARVHALTAALTPFTLTAFHELVTLPGSWVVGFAALNGWHSAPELWQAAHVDEIWQAEHWGDDEEALAARALKQEAFETALRFARMLA